MPENCLIGQPLWGGKRTSAQLQDGCRKVVPSLGHKKGSFLRTEKSSFSMLYLFLILRDRYSPPVYCLYSCKICTHFYSTINPHLRYFIMLCKELFLEFFRRLHKPTFDQANSTVLYRHSKKKVDNKIAPELKTFLVLWEPRYKC